MPFKPLKTRRQAEGPKVLTKVIHDFLRLAIQTGKTELKLTGSMSFRAGVVANGFGTGFAASSELGMDTAGNAAPSDLYITPELHRRVPKTTDHLREKLALQDIAAQMVDHPEQVLPKLVERAMEMTGAASAGISEFETQDGTAGIFRWRDLKGELARFEGATTPRDFSPCGVCLDRFEPTLTRRPERHYTWIAKAGVCCPEVLLVPLYIARGQPLGTLWIVSEFEGYFDSGHARIMRELASFTGIALAMLRDQQRLH
jgi:hypothetical protein